MLYPKVEADELIGKLMAEIERLTMIAENSKRVEDCYFRHFKEIKRALWLTRAKNAQRELVLLDYYTDEDWEDMPGLGYEEESRRWTKVEKLCRKKAQEYK